MKKYFIMAMATMMFLGALTAKAEEIDDISAEITRGKIEAAELAQRQEDQQRIRETMDVTEGKIAAAADDQLGREARELSAIHREIRGTLSSINSLSAKLEAQTEDRGLAKLGTEVDTANQMVQELASNRASSKQDSLKVLQTLKVILSEIRAAK